jgi:heme exporter protein A
MLEAQDLAAQRGHARLFSGVTLALPSGRALAVSGPNGSGKTTLLRMLAGLTAPAAGVIRFNGETMRPFHPRLRGAVAFVGHLPALKDELTAEENLASLVALGGTRASPHRPAAALDPVALTGPRALPARVLSQGQRRRIALARLALADKALWILDEPATALDAEGSALLARLVGEHVAAGGSVVMATHQPLELPPGRTQALALG